MENSSSLAIAPATVNRTVRRRNAELRTREHLTADEVERLIEAASLRQRIEHWATILRWHISSLWGPSVMMRDVDELADEMMRRGLFEEACEATRKVAQASHFDHQAARRKTAQRRSNGTSMP
jgi:hypothetical protein